MAEHKTPFHNPFAAIAHLRGDLPDVVEQPAVEPASARRPGPVVVARAVVRIERSGRGGKEVTVIEHLGLTADELAAWLKALKASLGCGGSVEDGAIMLQGDQRKRLPGLLSDRGVRRVTVA